MNLRRAFALAVVTPLIAVGALSGAAVASDQTTGDGARLVADDEVVVGQEIHLEGTGWRHPSGGGSAIAIKLDAPGPNVVTTTRTVIDPVSGAPFADKTVWAAVQADANGDFSLDIPLPTASNADRTWAVGETHAVRLLTGSLKSGDQARSVAASVVVVNQPSSCDAEPTVGVAPATAEFGGSIRVFGTAWCHPTDGGSRIAIKIDAGAHRRVTDVINGNATIWAIVEADASGAFEADIPLPDGTTTTSVDADGAPLASGAHTLNFLSGSLKPEDTPRAAVADFQIGAYRPSGPAEPLGDDQLVTDTRGGVTLTRTAQSLKVAVPGTAAGDWVHLDVYVDGAPWAPWGGTTWHQVGAGGVVTANLRGVTLPTGSSKVTVQSGNRGSLHELLGWVPMTVESADDEEGGQQDDTTSTGGRSSSSGGGAATTATAAVAPVVGAAVAPSTAPAKPVAGVDDLDESNAGPVSGRRDGDDLVIRVGDVGADQWVHVWLYDEQGDVALGWAQLDADSSVRVDVAALGDAGFKLAVQDEAGALLGWTGVEAVTPARAAGAGGTGGPSAAPAVADATSTSRSTTLLNIGLSGIGLLSLAVTCGVLYAGRTPGKALS